jgi:hypothetical protein
MFAELVKLYRQIQRPLGVSGRIEFDGESTPELLTSLHLLQNAPDHLVTFDSLEVKDGTVSFELRLPSNEAGKFYANIPDFVRRSPSLGRGIFPKNFYVYDIDYSSTDEVAPQPIVNLAECCEFIRLLRVLAIQTDDATNVGAEGRLIFVLAADGKSPSKTLTVRTTVDERCVDVRIPHLNLLRALLSDDRKNQIHIEERRSIMRLAIADTLANKEDDLFYELIRQWSSVLLKYRHNFLAFINQYSFEKVRKEIATAEVEHATKLSSVLGDIAGKLLALPVTLAGVILLRNAANNFDFSVLAIGLGTISLVFAGILVNQWLQVERLRESFNLIFGQYTDKISTYPQKLRVPVLKAQEVARRQQRVLQITFAIFTILAFVPIVAVIVVIIERYALLNGELLTWLAGSLRSSAPTTLGF